MSAIWRGYKQYFVTCEHDNKICGEYEHECGRASTIKSAKAIICKTRKEGQYTNARNFKVFDSWADVDETTNYVPCVYEEK